MIRGGRSDSKSSCLSSVMCGISFLSGFELGKTVSLPYIALSIDLSDLAMRLSYGVDI